MASICKKCLLSEITQADKDMIQKYKDAIRKAEQVDDKVYNDRLMVCKQCDMLNQGTCNACGCYVELRAAAIVSHCPYKKW